MSRTYYEWMAAKRKWFDEQQRRKAQIPHPGIDSFDHVVYQRHSTSSYWESRRSNAESLVPQNLNFNFKDTEIESFIRAAAQYEFQKEQEFLQEFYTDNNTEDSHIDKFNVLFQSREQYKALNKRIKDILSNKQFQENKDQSKHKYFTGMAPNISSIFTSYFEAAFRIELDNFYSQISKRLIDNDPDAVTRLFNEAIERAIISASERIVYQMAASDIYGSGEEWKPILEMLQNRRELNIFTEGLKRAIGQKNLDDLQQELVGRKKIKARAAVPTNMKKYLGSLGAQTAQIGGSVLEIVSALMAEYMHGSGNNINYQMAAQQFGSNIVLTDTMMLYSKDVTIDLQSLLVDLDQKMREGGTTTNMREVYKRIQNFYTEQDWENKLDKLYMVYVNAKNYGIGHDGNDYTKVYRGTLEELPEFLQANGIKIDSAIDFLNFAYNTGEGAIRNSARQDLWKNAVNALKAAAAKIMFDDYQSFGQGEENAIHMYLLSGKYIPSSTVLFAMADAAHDAKVNANANVNLPNSIEDEGPEWADLKHQSDTDVEFKEALWDYWKEEYKRAKEASNWSLSFTLRIKQILSNSVNVKI